MRVDRVFVSKVHHMQTFLNTFTNENAVDVFQYQALRIGVEPNRRGEEWSFDVSQLAKLLQ